MLLESVLSFCHVGPRIKLRLVRLVNKHAYPLSAPGGPLVRSVSELSRVLYNLNIRILETEVCDGESASIVKQCSKRKRKENI